MTWNFESKKFWDNFCGSFNEKYKKSVWFKNSSKRNILHEKSPNKIIQTKSPMFFFLKTYIFLSLQLNTAFDELILKECYLKGAFSLTHTQFNCAKNSISHFLFISLRKNWRKKMSFRLSGLNLISHISFDGSHFNRLPNWTKHRIT